MPIIDKNDIALGIGNVEFGSYDANDNFIAYSDIGAIKTEVTITNAREILPFETGRPLITIIQEVIREKVTVALTFAEIRVATIKQALGQGVITYSTLPTFLDGSSTALHGTLQAGLTQVTSGELFAAGGVPTHAFIGLRFTHIKSNGKRQIFEAFRASPMGNLALPFRETDWNLTAVEFNLLADTNRNAGEQYYQLFIERA